MHLLDYLRQILVLVCRWSISCQISVAEVCLVHCTESHSYHRTRLVWGGSNCRGYHWSRDRWLWYEISVGCSNIRNIFSHGHLERKRVDQEKSLLDSWCLSLRWAPVRGRCHGPCWQRGCVYWWVWQDVWHGSHSHSWGDGTRTSHHC